MKSLTRLYAACVAAMVAALFFTRVLPLVDYPQHLAIAATLRRVWAGGPERALFDVNVLGFNSLFHVAVAVLSFAVPIELAGKLVIGASFATFAYALIALVDATEQPRWRAFVMLPLMVGYSFAFGFVNFGLGLAIQLIVLARVMKRAPWLPTAGLALLGMYGHVLATALVFVLVGIVILMRREWRAFLPLLPALLYFALVFRGNAQQNAAFVAVEGMTIPLLLKVTAFGQFASGLRADGIDELVVFAAVGLIGLGALLREKGSALANERLAMFVVAVALYLLLPHVFFATAFVFQRVALLVVLTFVLWAPSPREALVPIVRGGAVAVGVVSSLLFVQSMVAARGETRDLDVVLDAAPEGKKLLGLVFDPRLPSFRQHSMLHVPALYAVRHRGDFAVWFDTVSLPVRRKVAVPGLPPLFELTPGVFNAGAPYAAWADLALVKAPLRPEDPRPFLFPGGTAKIVASSGMWFLIEVR